MVWCCHWNILLYSLKKTSPLPWQYPHHEPQPVVDSTTELLQSGSASYQLHFMKGMSSEPSGKWFTAVSLVLYNKSIVAWTPLSAHFDRIPQGQGNSSIYLFDTRVPFIQVLSTIPLGPTVGVSVMGETASTLTGHWLRAASCIPVPPTGTQAQMARMARDAQVIATKSQTECKCWGNMGRFLTASTTISRGWMKVLAVETKRSMLIWKVLEGNGESWCVYI